MKKLFLRMGDYIRSADKLLALLVLLVCGFGITVLTGVVKSFSSTNSLLIVQLAAMGIGFVAALCLSCMDYHLTAKLWKLYVPLAIGLVVLTFFHWLRSARSGRQGLDYAAGRQHLHSADGIYENCLYSELFFAFTGRRS